MFYQMGGTWRIMNDPKMRSARKRRSDGMETFEDHTDTTTQRAQNIQSGRPEGVCVCVVGDPKEPWKLEEPEGMKVLKNT